MKKLFSFLILILISRTLLAQCNVGLPTLSENFDALSGSNVPTCWTTPYGIAEIAVNLDGQGAFGTTGYINMTQSIGDPRHFVLRKFDNTNGTLNFRARKALSNTATTLEVGVMTNPTNIATFTVIATFNLTTTYTLYNADFSNYVGTGQYIAFRSYYSSYTALDAPYNTYIDNINYTSFSGPGSIIYVDKDATGANNGTSWANAYTELSTAITSSTFNLNQEIWVADGTYKPHASSRTTYFDLPHKCQIYGGFNGTETLRSQRNPTVNIVRLSGDLSGNDNTNIINTEATRSENSLHIFRVQGEKRDIVVDGVTISGANANTSGSENTAGMILTVHNAADQLMSLNFNNVIVEKNTAINAAVYQNYHFASQGGTTILNFTNSVIRNNVGTSTLGNMLYVGNNTNNQKNYGAITNTLFYGNSCTTGASTIYNKVNNGSGSVCPMKVLNCTFSNNVGISGKVIDVSSSPDSRYVNNIIYNNGGAAPIAWSNSGVVASVFQNNIINDAVFGLNQDPLFRNAATNDYRVDCTGNSPAIDAGSSSAITPMPTTDFAGNPRTIGIVDMGAYEYQHEIEIISSASLICPGGGITLSSNYGTGVVWSNGIVPGVPFFPVTTQTYTATGTNENNCSQVASINIPVVSIANKVVTPATSNICSGGNVTINVENTDTDIYYYLRDDANNSVVAGPTLGTGAAINFPVNGITSSKVYNVNGKKVINTNGALDLDGTNDYVNLGTDNRSITSTVTVSARVRTTVNGTSQFVAVKYLSAGIGYYLVITGTGYASMQGRDVAGGIKSSGVSTTMVADNQWHEITGVVRNTGWEIWVDGVLQNSGAYSLGATGLGTTAPLLVGQFGSTGYSALDIDKIAIWNTALSPAQILANVNTCLVGNEANLKAYFNFNETSGTVVTDLSPTAINGTLVNMTAPACWIDGGINECTQYCEKEMTQLATVNVSDVVAPVANLASLPNITAPCQVTSLTAPTATDNCAGAITGTHNATFPITINTTVVWSYNDGNGNISTQNQSVLINDNVAPVANLASLPNITSQCPITSLTAPIATDNCAGTITGTHNATFPISINTTVTWSYNDGKGNISTQTQQVIINDNIAPVANVASLSPVTAQCQITSLTAPTATDNCAGTITGTHNAIFPITVNTTVTWTYNDGKGNISTQTQNVVINDNIAPVANLASLPNVTAQCQVTSLTAPTATDNCVGAITGTHNATFPITINTTVVWTYNDGHGNTSTQNQSVVINDNIAPVANLASLPNVTAQCQVTSLTAPTATDNCMGTITGTHNATLPILVTTTVTWSYNDGKGNISTQTQQVIINDNVAPVANIASLPAITSQCQIASLTAPTATDNCVGTITGTTNVTFPITVNTTVTWTYNDGKGNISTQTQTVVINDNIAPVANVASLSPVTAQCQITSLTAPTATDNCAGTITGTHNGIFPITVNTTITWTYNDGKGNISTQTQSIVINDNTAPVANLASLANVTAQCQVTSLTAPTATDNCEGIITGTLSVIFPITSSTSVTWTYNDGNGNISTQIQQVVINDNTAPVANLATLSTLSAQCEIASLVPPTATDNCVGQITGTHSITLPITVSSNIIWSYDDGQGNISTQTQAVVINDNIVPVADAVSLNDITSECEITSLIAPTATDNCAGSITGTHNLTLPISSSTTITWTYLDGNGNTSTQTQNVVIDDITNPIPNVATLADINQVCEVTSLTPPTATDNCLGTITGTHNATLPITANTTIVWEFEDGNNNIVTQNQNIIITAINNATSISGITMTADQSGATYQWVDCNNGNAPINTATQQSFTPMANGSYAVEVTVGSCTETSACVTITSVGIDENTKLLPIVIYPVPAINSLNIETAETIEQITIYSMIGELVQTETKSNFSIELLASGMYVIQVKTANGIWSSRFIKE